MIEQQFKEKLDAFLKGLESIVKDETDVFPVEVGADINKKFIRVWRKSGPSKSAYCFIEVETGIIWKPAGWKAPIKNVPRGNIYDENPFKWCNKYTIGYAK